MKILVTGGAGFIGSHLVRNLLADDHEVLNVDLLTHAGSRETIADLIDLPTHRLLERDVSKADSMRKAFREFQPDQVIHLAAESHVDRSIEAPQRFIETNILGTYVLLQESLEYWQQLEGTAREQFRLLHVSTDEVYGSVGASDSFSERSRYDPHSPYSASKAASDHLVNAWHHTYGLPTLVTHCCNNYGPHQSPDKLVPVIILNALKGHRIPIYGQGDHWREWLHVEDHVEALQQVLHKGRPGECYNISGSLLLPNLMLAKEICGHLDDLQPQGKPHADLITFVEDRPGHDERYCNDDFKLRDETGWEPSRDPEAGFKETVRWYLDHQDWTEHMLNKLKSAN